MNSLVCPFCNTPFDPPGLPGRVACPRCGEAIPAKLLPAQSRGSSVATMDRPAPAESAPARRRPVAVFGVLLFSVVLAGLGIWYFTRGPKPETSPTNVLKIPPATRPPTSLPALGHLPPETQIAMAVQPSPLIQYAERMGKKPEALLAELGMPDGLLTVFAQAGVPLDQLNHLAVGVSLSESPIPRLFLVVYLQNPLESERKFREAFKARQNADKPGRSQVEIPGIPLPLQLQRLDDNKLLFSSDEKAIDGMMTTQPGVEFLKLGLRESIAKLDPASFAWVATDNQDWAGIPALKLAAGLLKQNEWPKRLTGVRSLALSLTLRPDLDLLVRVRWPDAKTAAEFEARSQPKLAGTTIQLQSEEQWSAIQTPAAASGTTVPKILGLFDR